MALDQPHHYESEFLSQAIAALKESKTLYEVEECARLFTLFAAACSIETRRLFRAALKTRRTELETKPS